MHRLSDLSIDCARSVFWRCGINVTRLTGRDPIIELVRRLKPHNLGFDLIRLGGNHDGGYLLPNDLEGIQYCFSPGVSDTASFEIDLLDRGIFSFLADYSVDHAPPLLKKCQFTKKHIGIIDSNETITFDSWVHQGMIDHSSHELLLQMDIEGAEFDVLLSTSIETLQRFRIMIIEFHSLHHIANPQQYDLILKTFTKLLTLFDIAHVHPNNYGGSAVIRGIKVPRMLEITFLRQDRVKQKLPVGKLPHPLDRENVRDQAKLNLPGYWYE